MARTKPRVLRLSELTAEQYADCFVLLVEKKHGVTRCVLCNSELKKN